MRRRPWLPALILAGLLAACGRPAGEQAAPPTEPAASALAATAPPPTAPPPTAAPPEPSAPPAAAVPPREGSAAATTADGLPQGRTAEGYPVLGDPAAPVTLTMYSDFL